MDTLSKSQRSNVMRAIKSVSQMEASFKINLKRLGYKFNASNHKMIGKPDLVFKQKKLAVFIDSCFWHGCSKHCRMPSGNRGYWKEKIERNKRRDRLVNKAYKNLGWNVLRLWEHQIKKSSGLYLSKINSYL